MADIPVVNMYEGRPLTSLNHEELLEAANYAWHEIKTLRKGIHQLIRIQRLFDETLHRRS